MSHTVNLMRTDYARKHSWDHADLEHNHMREWTAREQSLPVGLTTLNFIYWYISYYLY